MQPALILLLVAFLSFVFGWNNGSFLIGDLRASGSLTAGAAIVVSGAGLLIGAIIEGPKMTSSLVGTLAPASSDGVILAALAVSVVLLFVLSVVKMPMSLSMALVAAFLGASYGAGFAISPPRTAVVVIFWFAAPASTALLTLLLYMAARRLVAGLPLATVDLLNRSGSAVSAFLVSYTLGANNLGLLQSSVIAADSTASSDAAVLSAIAIGLAILAFLGAVAFGRGAVVGSMGDRMLALLPQGVVTLLISSSIVVWVGTQLAVPISITQCVLGGMFGASLAKKLAVMNMKLVYETLLSWVLVPVVAFVVAWAALSL